MFLTPSIVPSTASFTFPATSFAFADAFSAASSAAFLASSATSFLLCLYIAGNLTDAFFDSTLQLIDLIFKRHRNSSFRVGSDSALKPKHLFFSKEKILSPLPLPFAKEKSIAEQPIPPDKHRTPRALISTGLRLVCIVTQLSKISNRTPILHPLCT